MRWKSIWELSEHPIYDQRIVALLVPMLQTQHNMERLKILQALRFYRNEAATQLPYLLPHLKKLFSDPDPWIRQASAAAYANLNTTEDISEAVMILAEQLQDLTEELELNNLLKSMAVMLLKELGPRAAPAREVLMRTAKDDGSPFTRIDAKKILKEIDGTSP